jgi:hypothetical protein
VLSSRWSASSDEDTENIISKVRTKLPSFKIRGKAVAGAADRRDAEEEQEPEQQDPLQGEQDEVQKYQNKHDLRHQKRPEDHQHAHGQISMNTMPENVGGSRANAFKEQQLRERQQLGVQAAEEDGVGSHVMPTSTQFSRDAKTVKRSSVLKHFDDPIWGGESGTLLLGSHD